MAAILKTNFGTKKEILLFAATFIPAVIILNLVMYGIRYFTEWKFFLISTFVGLVISVALQNTLVVVNVFVRKSYPAYKDTVKRFLFCLSATIITTCIFLLVYIWVYQFIPVLRFPVTQNIIIIFLLVGIIFNIVSSSIHEAFYTFGKFRETLVETEGLKKEQLQKQFDNLKTKVNPHFLFNSLSSLSTLVSEDTEKADIFLNEMSKVYRYMLRSNQHEWVTMQQELGFIQSYFLLLKTRYGSSITLQNTADEKYNSYTLPPLTLQLLVDNAVKHNTTGKEQPLQIWITTNSNNTLTVKNNLQKKHRPLQGDTIGLKSLEAKFNLQNLAGFSVGETPSEFMVTIPLQYSNEIHTSTHGKS
jgi:LytS/YehU family sensor histidine kinase